LDELPRQYSARDTPEFVLVESPLPQSIEGVNMARKLNPFNELYVSETVKPDQFVRLFSPSLVSQAEEVFLPGNVVVQGVQGSGKTMLLNLLKPEVRIAYQEAGEKFPVPDCCRRFVGAGINLTTSRAVDFGQRPFPLTGGTNEQLLPLYFGDFLNYWVVYDLLRSVEILWRKNSHSFSEEVGICAESSRMECFSDKISKRECWFGYLDKCEGYTQLKDRIASRVTEYRTFLNFNRRGISPDIVNSKTQIGEPISKTVETLRKCGVLAADVNVFVRIDQYEELLNLEEAQKDVGEGYRAVVNKALGMRDDTASYRIGTRRYAWKEDFEIFATRARLERDRNYKLVDMDLMLRRQENSRRWIFPAFAENVFTRRLEFANYEVPAQQTALRVVFGRGLSPEEKARLYCKRSSARLIKVEPDWPRKWAEFLKDLAQNSPLQARLGDAWARQKGNEKENVMHNIPKPPYPWQKKYWAKERIDPALMQIAGRAAQRQIWEGKDDVLHLSGGNILVFVSVCQHIWNSWLRTQREAEDESSALPEIGTNEQAVGIHEASRHWFNKISENTNGNRRQRFVAHVGRLLSKRLYNDLSLSYPGANGFSVSVDDLRRDPEATQFLFEAVYYGDLFSAPHTTKMKDRRPRIKWYLNPILSPHLRLTHTHTKEPWYIPIALVRTWLEQVDDTRVKRTEDPYARETHQAQLPLF
jgi:hypothetical protein